MGGENNVAGNARSWIDVGKTIARTHKKKRHDDLDHQRGNKSRGTAARYRPAAHASLYGVNPSIRAPHIRSGKAMQYAAEMRGDLDINRHQHMEQDDD